MTDHSRDIPGIPKVPSTIDMIIKLEIKTSNVSVSGPLNNRVLAYGMLEMAKEAISKMSQNMNSVPESNTEPIIEKSN